MKAIVVKNNLKEAISVAEKITSKSLSLPILGNILIYSEGKNLKIIATNLELGIEIEIPAKIEKKGKIAVPAGVINNFLSSLLSEEKVVLEAINNNLFISTDNSSTTIKGQDPSDFPNLPKPEGKKEFSIPSNDFVSGLKSVWYASSFSTVKPEISSVFINCHQSSHIVFVATDSFRLAEKRIRYNTGDGLSLLLPFKSVGEIIRIFGEKNTDLRIISDKNQVFFSVPNITFVSRIVEGVFPDYQQIIPKKFTTDVIIEKNAFLNAMKTAGIFAGRLNEINFSIDTSGSALTIQTVNNETGEHVSNTPARITGEEEKITFNYKYIIDCLPYILSTDVLLRFSGPNKPLIITGTEDNSFQYLVMPMNS